MIRTTLRRLSPLLLLLSLSAPAFAAEPCLSPEDLEPDTAGICITRVPAPGDGLLKLGSRILQPGDVLTAGQAAEMRFHPAPEPRSPQVCFSYLPVSEEGTEAGQTAVLSLRKGKNQAPAAEDSAAETYKNIPCTARLRVRDPEEEALRFTLVREPRRGTVVLNPDGSFTYTPKKNKVGTDSFTYTASDPGGNPSREATVTVRILKPSDAPQYVDTLGRSCRFAAEWMKHTGLFSGETLSGASCFQPDRPVTGTEFLTVLMKALDIPPEPALTGQMDQVPGWFQPYLAAAIRSGITAGLPYDLQDRETLTEAEAAVMLQNGLDLPVPPAAQASVSENGWAEPALCALRNQGIGLEADRVLTRGRAAELLYALTGAPD